MGSVTPRTLLRSMLRQKAVFEGGGETEIFLSSRAHMERESSKFFQVPEPRGKLGIFPSPRAYLEETVRRVKSRQQSVFEGLYQRGGWARGGVQGLKET